jgi:hypothetical protein
LVVGISLAIVGAVLTAASLPGHMPSMALGVGLFIAGAAIGAAFASNLPHSTLSARQRHVERNEESANGASMPSSFRDSIASMQFGPDPEQVIGRQTGARTSPTVRTSDEAHPLTERQTAAASIAGQDGHRLRALMGRSADKAHCISGTWLAPGETACRSRRPAKTASWSSSGSPALKSDIRFS